MAPYKAGRPIDDLARAYNLDPKTIIKMASNENPLGFSEKVKNAVANALQEHSAQDLARYPDPNGFHLKAAIARHYSVPANTITLGNGSNDLLEIVSLAFLDDTRACLYAQHAFAVYHLSTQGRGATHIQIPAKNFGADLDAMFEAITPDTSVIFIANPNNPTGTFHSGSDLEAFIKRVHDHYGRSVLVVLDEAYTEYLDPAQRYDSISWLKKYDNLIITRTFSKAYGLAAWRIGFALAHPELTDFMNRVRQPFNVGALSQIAAVTALEDQDFIQKTYELNKAGKQYLCREFERLGLEYVPSSANFVLVKIGPKVAQVNESLLRAGVIVRPTGGDGLPEHLRVSIGLQSENEAFIKALEKSL